MELTRTQHVTKIDQGHMPIDWLLFALNERGLDLETIKANAEISAEGLEKIESGILSLHDYNDVFEWAACKLNDSDLAIHIVDSQKPEDIQQYGILGYLMYNSATIKDCFDVFNKYQRIFAPDFDAEFVSEGESCSFVYRKPNARSWEYPQDINLTLATAVAIIRWQAGSGMAAKSVQVTYPKPLSDAAIEHFFGTSVSFDKPENKVTIDADVLPIPIKNADPVLLSILTSQADLMLNDVQQSANLIGQVKMLLSANLERADYDLKALAKQLGMSQSSLRRKLNAHQTSYRQLQIEVILSAARIALQNQDASVTSIAFMLGFADVGSFSRMFRQHEGITPREFRYKFSR